MASLRRFTADNVHWDTRALELTYVDSSGKTKVYCQTPYLHQQWVIEYVQPNQAYPAQSSYEQRQRAGTVDEWHLRFGHLYSRAVKELTKGTKDGIVTNSSYEKICEICKLATATE